MSTQYRLVQSGKTASGGCSAGQGSSEPVMPQIYYFFILLFLVVCRGYIEHVILTTVPSGRTSVRHQDE
jgi:hypothetical protein